MKLPFKLYVINPIVIFLSHLNYLKVLINYVCEKYRYTDLLNHVEKTLK
jgi:hypothetical protein